MRFRPLRSSPWPAASVLGVFGVRRTGLTPYQALASRWRRLADLSITLIGLARCCDKGWYPDMVFLQVAMREETRARRGSHAKSVARAVSKRYLIREFGRARSTGTGSVHSALLLVHRVWPECGVVPCPPPPRSEVFSQFDLFIWAGLPLRLRGNG